MALLVTVTMIVAYRWRDRPRLATAALFGAVIALAALARGEGILLLPLLAVPWIMLTRTLSCGVRFRHLVVTTAACIAVLAPWMVRNAVTFEKFVPLSTNGNEVMVYANCATAYNGQFVGYWDFQCQQTVREAQGDPPGDESETALYWRSLGFDYAREHIGELPRVMTLRVLAAVGAVPSAAERHAGRHRGSQSRCKLDGPADVLRAGRVVDRRRCHHASPCASRCCRSACSSCRSPSPRRTRMARCGSAPRPSPRCACSARSVWCRSLHWRVDGWPVTRPRSPTTPRSQRPMARRSCSVVEVACVRASAEPGGAARSRRGLRSDPCAH